MLKRSRRRTLLQVGGGGGCSRRHFAISFAGGGILLLIGTVLALFSWDVRDAVQRAVESQTTLEPGTEFSKIWLHPPVVPKTKIFVFNVTNSEAFLAGKERPRVEEVGPFVYLARPHKFVDSWTEEEMTFRARTRYEFLAEESFADAGDVVVTVPNVLLFSGMLKSEVRHLPDLLKQNIVWPVLMSAGRKAPFLTMTVAEFIWGYEDELACLDDDDDYQDDGFFSTFDWLEEEEEDWKIGEKEKKKNVFRRPDGRCVFGALVERNTTCDKPVTVMTGRGDFRDRGKIVEIDGKSSFGKWASSKCDSFAGNQEPSALAALAPGSQNSFDLHMGIMCRSIRLEAEEEEDGVGYFGGRIATRRFYPSRGTFNFGDDNCFGQGKSGLPHGAMSVRDCQDGTPLAVSFPHFLHGSPWYTNNVEGVSTAQESLHRSYLDLEPSLGGSLAIQMRLQVNLVVERDENFPPLANLSSEEDLTVLPMFWVQEGFDSPDRGSLIKLYLALQAPDIARFGLPTLVLLLATVLICAPVLCCRTSKNFEYPLKKTKKAFPMYDMIPFDDITSDIKV